MRARGTEKKRAAAKRPSRGPASEHRAGRPRISRADAIRRITRFLPVCETRTVQMADLCRVSGVSERTLRAIVMEVFCMSPMRYLRTRKLHAIRAELSVADPDFETVTSIARRLGVRDCGRMARDYCEIFGEYPRDTLDRRVAARENRV